MSSDQALRGGSATGYTELKRKTIMRINWHEIEDMVGDIFLLILLLPVALVAIVCVIVGIITEKDTDKEVH